MLGGDVFLLFCIATGLSWPLVFFHNARISCHSIFTRKETRTEKLRGDVL